MHARYAAFLSTPSADRRCPAPPSCEEARAPYVRARHRVDRRLPGWFTIRASSPRSPVSPAPAFRTHEPAIVAVITTACPSTRCHRTPTHHHPLGSANRACGSSWPQPDSPARRSRCSPARPSKKCTSSSSAWISGAATVNRSRKESRIGAFFASSAIDSASPPSERGRLERCGANSATRSRRRRFHGLPSIGCPSRKRRRQRSSKA